VPSCRSKAGKHWLVPKARYLPCWLLAFTEKVKKTHLENVVFVAACLHVWLAQFFGGSRTFLRESEVAKPKFQNVF
jgi:hypothetical protein